MRTDSWKSTDPAKHFVSLLPLIGRGFNVDFGFTYTAIEKLTLPHSALFYRIVVVLQMALTMPIVRYALR